LIAVVLVAGLAMWLLDRAHARALDAVRPAPPPAPPSEPKAVVVPPALDAVDRVQQQADLAASTRRTEEAVRKGAAEIKALYAEAGMTVTDEQARAEAESLLRGDAPLDPLAFGGRV